MIEHNKINFKQFFDENEERLYYSNIESIRKIAFTFILAMVFFIFGTFVLLPESSNRQPLAIIHGVMFIVMLGMMSLASYLLKIEYNKKIVSQMLTYLTMFLSMTYILLISIFISTENTRASFFLLFNILLPSLFSLRRRDILISILSSATVFLLLSYFFRSPQMVISDQFLAYASVIIGIPYNIMISNIRMNDAFVMKSYHTQASVDELSGIPNRRSYNEDVKKLYLKASFNNVSIIILDLDNFKNINDELGHLHGDYVIRKVGQVLKVFATENQISAYRIGGDEFVLIGTDLMISRLYEILDQLTIKLNEVDTKSNYLMNVSIGAFFTTDIHQYSPEEFFHKADEALYYTKNNNKGLYKLVIDEKNE